MTKEVLFKSDLLTANFNDSENVAITPNGDAVVKQALVAIEGSFKDSSGTEYTFDKNRLATIEAHTNRALAVGHILPVCTDHKKTIDNTVGTVDGLAYTKVITESDLPNEKAKHLVGKLGLFLKDVSIKAQDVADKVKKGIVSSVSMGLNLDPSDHRIMELSLVPIPAIPNMGLFRKTDDDGTVTEVTVASFNFKDTSNVFTWQDLEVSEETIDDLKEQYNELTENLWKLLNNIYTSDSIDVTDEATLRQYVYGALNGFSIRVVDILGLTTSEDLAANEAETQSADDAQKQAATQAADIAANSANSSYSRYSRLAKFSRTSRYSRG